MGETQWHTEHSCFSSRDTSYGSVGKMYINMLKVCTNDCLQRALTNKCTRLGAGLSTMEMLRIVSFSNIYIYIVNILMFKKNSWFIYDINIESYSLVASNNVSLQKYCFRLFDNYNMRVFLWALCYSSTH